MADPADTIRVRAAALQAATGLSDDSRQRLAQVARATERARYAAHVPPMDGLQRDAAVVRQQIMAVASRRTRWQAVLWPAPMRRLLRRR